MNVLFTVALLFATLCIGFSSANRGNLCHRTEILGGKWEKASAWETERHWSGRLEEHNRCQTPSHVFPRAVYRPNPSGESPEIDDVCVPPSGDKEREREVGEEIYSPAHMFLRSLADANISLLLCVGDSTMRYFAHYLQEELNSLSLSPSLSLSIDAIVSKRVKHRGPSEREMFDRLQWWIERLPEGTGVLLYGNIGLHYHTHYDLRYENSSVYDLEPTDDPDPPLSLSPSLSHSPQVPQSIRQERVALRRDLSELLSFLHEAEAQSLPRRADSLPLSVSLRKRIRVYSVARYTTPQHFASADFSGVYAAYSQSSQGKGITPDFVPNPSLKEGIKGKDGINEGITGKERISQESGGSRGNSGIRAGSPVHEDGINERINPKGTKTSRRRLRSSDSESLSLPPSNPLKLRGPRRHPVQLNPAPDSLSDRLSHPEPILSSGCLSSIEPFERWEDALLRSLSEDLCVDLVDVRTPLYGRGDMHPGRFVERGMLGGEKEKLDCTHLCVSNLSYAPETIGLCRMVQRKIRARDH